MAELNLAPEDISFEEAIALTQSLLTQMEQGNLSEAEIGAAIAALVSSMNGARGFFVTYLSDERAIADQPSEAVMQALQTSPEIVSDLLIKNLAMSSAMAITHRRNGNEDMAQGSDRVRSRTAHLIKQLQLASVVEKAQKLHESASTGLGEYKAFLDRWGYDAEQRQVIQQSMEGAIGLATDDSVNE
ncbi:MAG: hypothetical protein HC879_09575 [Leptolyngbyaceae cyanobacterium SL_5_9]|nr:hypothetical protein [Leptolyngbyaceae cyanobacterium SL_5_9]NJO76364.1 hypothetical protein [Leptolyngbyaceae cyanobacterium RM1_406_9]